MASISSSAIANLLSIFNPSSKPPPPPPKPPLLSATPSHLTTFDSLPIRSSSSTSCSSSSSSARNRNKDGRGPPTTPNDPLYLSSPSSSSDNDIMSVVCPSLAYANTLFFRSAYNVQVVVDENEPEEKLLNRFRREVMKAGVIQECRRRRFYETKQDEKKRKSREAARRNRRRRPQSRSSFQDKQDSSKSKKDDEDDDNWDLPDGDLPY